MDSSNIIIGANMEHFINTALFALSGNQSNITFIATNMLSMPIKLATSQKGNPNYQFII